MDLSGDQQASGGDQCFVCGSEGTDVTEQSQVVLLTGLALTCPELSSLGRRSGIPIGMCDEATALAKASCGCLQMELHSTPKTPSPSFVEKCNICATQGAVVVNPTAEVIFKSEVATCRDLYHDGLMVSFRPCGTYPLTI